MAIINKEGLVRRINDKMGEGLAKSHNVLETVMQVIAETLQEGHDVRVKGFGVFHLKNVKERTVNIPLKEGTSNLVPAHTGIQFKPSTVLRDSLKSVTISPY